MDSGPAGVGAAEGGLAAGGEVTVTAAGSGSVAAGVIGQLHRHVHQAPRGPVVWPHTVGVVPPRAGAFQDRAERARLRAALAGGGTAVLCQVLTGMGGVGKTQLAADLAREVCGGPDGAELLVWVTATGRDAVVAAFAQAGAEVCGADPADPPQAARTFLAWLATGHRRWLVVLDDVADPNDLTGLWPPAVATGRTVLTTRRRDAALSRGDRRLIDVGVFTPREALTYLTSVLTPTAEPAAADRAGSEPADPDSTAADRAGPAPVNGEARQLEALAVGLGCLPLALSQAAAYIADAGIGVPDYRERLARRARTLEDLSPDALPDDQAHTMAAAWRLSVEYADQLRPAGIARPMLELTAFLAPGGIPAPVLTAEPVLAHLAGRAGRAVTGEDAEDALRALHRVSLLSAPGVEEEGAGRRVRVHQVVQRATREALSPQEFGRAADAAAAALRAAWPEVERDTALAQALRDCAAALMSCTDDSGCLYGSGADAVFFRAGTSLGQAGQPGAATDYFTHLAATAARHIGADHRHTLVARHNAAFWHGETGDPAGGADRLAAVVADMARVLGPEHPDVLTARHHVARYRGQAGDSAGAVAALADLVADHVRVLGPDHPGTLAVRDQHAERRGIASDSAGAVELFTALLADRLRVHGPDHPMTLATRNNLARWQGHAGDPALAAEILAEVAADHVRVMGPDSPATLNARHNHAHWVGHAGDAAGAVTAYVALLADRLRVLGPDHPDTLATRHNLAQWRGRAGDVTGAVADFTDVLRGRLRVLGPDHPDTLTTRSYLARWRGRAGDPREAVAAYTDLLADRLRVHGPDHPMTLVTRDNLAVWRGRSGDAAGAAQALAELLDDRVRLFGPDHPETATTRRFLAHWRTRAAGADGG
ncbi:tetratricopeptide repeat protein [Streptomyces sp. NPDC021224]|uniref:tetratricopeptide repeat protein n=1 Tax=unclassified Streptomyces TaxID=2593676 RepID=UPI00378A573C